MWLSQVETVAVSEIAQKLGLQSGRSGSFGPCPECEAKARGSTDKRGPIGLRRDNLGWKCHACGTGGSGVDLVSIRLTRRKFKDADQRGKNSVRGWYEDNADLEPIRPNESKETRGNRPPVSEVQALWKQSLKLSQVSADDPVLGYLRSRNLNLEALALTGVVRVTPNKGDYEWPKWWPGGRSMSWRLIAPAFDATGQFCSLHGRAVVDTKGAPKTLWPSGFQASGLFMPNRQAVKMMRGKGKPADGLLFVEGITDFIKASSVAESEGLDLAVLGGTSGSFQSIGQIRIPDEMKIYVGTDPDDKGDQYAKTIQMQLGGKKSFRLPLRSVDGGDGERP